LDPTIVIARYNAFRKHYQLDKAQNRITTSRSNAERSYELTRTYLDCIYAFDSLKNVLQQVQTLVLSKETIIEINEAILNALRKLLDAEKVYAEKPEKSTKGGKQVLLEDNFNEEESE
jgi:molecular chaperone GrpE (heat shock protein)